MNTNATHKPNVKASNPQAIPMKTIPCKATLISRLAAVVGAAALALTGGTAEASIAYGSINNFDTVNDTGSECHGFEIDIEDCHSTDISYTYNYNHYGVPNITEDNSVAGHPKTIIRWESRKNANGTWAAYTAIPAGPIAPTQGHQFTNPSVNFGGEHFGVGYNKAVGAVKYNWLIDNGAGALVNGGAVQVSTPVFTYYPPAPAQVLPQVQAVIAPPPPPAPPVFQFGKAVWVKDIKTTTHNPNKVGLEDLRDPDPANPAAKNWTNGEPAQVETQWRILQTEFANPANPKAELKGLAEDLPGGDEVITRRYEFYKYVGPLDADTGEAMGDTVGADGLHGAGVVTYADHFDPALGEWVTVTVNMATKVVVGDFTGAQMAAADVNAVVGLIEHVSDGKVNAPYVPRRIVVPGAGAFTATRTGPLPAGMTFDAVTGILSGTPTAGGQFKFKVTASDAANPGVAKNYTLTIAAAGAALPPASLVDTAASPVNGGTTTGDGSFAPGSNVTVKATANAGFQFVNWTDNGNVVSNTASYTFAINVNHSLRANFVQAAGFTIATGASPLAGGTTAGGGFVNNGANATVTATANAGYAFVNWTEGGVQVSTSASYMFAVTANRTLVANFVPTFQISTSASPAAGGSTGGGGTFKSGASVTVTATSNAGYSFGNWTEGGVVVSSSVNYNFSAAANRSLVANFKPIPPAVPAIVAPVSGAISVSVTPVFQASVFSGAAPGVTHAASQWLVRRVSDNVTVFNSGRDTAHLTAIQLGVPLAFTTGHRCWVRYQDNRGAWSGFSAPVTFTTQQMPVTSFLNFSGTYSGLIQSGQPRLCGIATVTLSATGAYSASVTINGTAWPATGTVNPDGTFAMTIVRAGLPSVNVSLVVDTTNASDQITGSISDGVAGAAVLLNRRVYSAANPVPANLTGAYTFLLPPDPAHTGATAPQGYGYGTLTLSANGGIAFTVTLGDGTRITRSTFLSKTATMAFHVAPYVDGGSAIGWLTFRDKPNASDFDGTLAWSKLPVISPIASTRYPAGFSLQTSAVGSKYTPPAAGVRAITLSNKIGNATINFSGGNLPAPMPIQTITLDTNNLVTAAPGSNVTMTLTLATGLFSGTFTLPGATSPTSFAGALFQKQDASGFGDAAGLFTYRLQTGSMVLTPVS